MRNIIASIGMALTKTALIEQLEAGQTDLSSWKWFRGHSIYRNCFMIRGRYQLLFIIWRHQCLHYTIRLNIVSRCDGYFKPPLTEDEYSPAMQLLGGLVQRLHLNICFDASDCSKDTSALLILWRQQIHLCTLVHAPFHLGQNFTIVHIHNEVWMF